MHIMKQRYSVSDFLGNGISSPTANLSMKGSECCRLRDMELVLRDYVCDSTHHVPTVEHSVGGNGDSSQCDNNLRRSPVSVISDPRSQYELTSIVPRRQRLTLPPHREAQPVTFESLRQRVVHRRPADKELESRSKAARAMSCLKLSARRRETERLLRVLDPHCATGAVSREPLAPQSLKRPSPFDCWVVVTLTLLGCA